VSSHKSILLTLYLLATLSSGVDRLFLLPPATVATAASAEFAAPSMDSNWERPEMVTRRCNLPAPSSRSSHNSWLKSCRRLERSREHLI
jgi:hypothetical protein